MKDPTRDGIITLVLTGVRKLLPYPKYHKGINLEVIKKILSKVDISGLDKHDRYLFKSILLIPVNGCFRIGKLLNSDGTATHCLG